MDENLSYDDISFVPQCVARAEKIVYTAEPFYSYFERRGSISHSLFSMREFDRVTGDRVRRAFYHDFFPQCEDAAAIAYIGSCLKVYYESRRSVEAKEKREALRNEIREYVDRNPELPYTKKQKLKVKLFQISPALYTISMRLRRR